MWLRKMTHHLNWQKLGKSITCISVVAMFILMTSAQNRYEVNNTVEVKENEVKKLLLWSPPKCVDCAPFQFFKSGNKIFKEMNCVYQNCYVVPNNEPLSSLDPSYYDAILFNGRPMLRMKREDLPQTRNPEQMYMFVQLESTARFPVCDKQFDDFFNWTVTYRLDSDIPWPYFVVKNENNETIGPSKDIDWKIDELPVSEDLKQRIDGKSKLAAWFVSNCHDISGRLKFVQKLNKDYLSKHNQTVDIYGKCGPFTCPRKQKAKCISMLKKDYLFYMAMENSLAEDYVTEKLVTALEGDAIPVVFGGADYRRFLPPGSYLDARQLGEEKLATTMMELMLNRTRAAEYFRWRYHYTYHENVSRFPGCACDICAMLNQRQKTYRRKHFRQWWNSDKNKCKYSDIDDNANSINDQE